MLQIDLTKEESLARLVIIYSEWPSSFAEEAKGHIESSSPSNKAFCLRPTVLRWTVTWESKNPFHQQLCLLKNALVKSHKRSVSDFFFWGKRKMAITRSQSPGWHIQKAFFVWQSNMWTISLKSPLWWIIIMGWNQVTTLFRGRSDCFIQWQVAMKVSQIHSWFCLALPRLNARGRWREGKWNSLPPPLPPSLCSLL